MILNYSYYRRWLLTSKSPYRKSQRCLGDVKLHKTKTYLDKDSEENDSEGARDEHVLLWEVFLLKERHQRETDGSTKPAVGLVNHEMVVKKHEQ